MNKKIAKKVKSFRPRVEQAMTELRSDPGLRHRMVRQVLDELGISQVFQAPPAADSPVLPVIPAADLIKLDLTSELWREYDFDLGDGQHRNVYRINEPVAMFTRRNATTHRVVDRNGVVHCLPTVGHRGCVVRWKSRPGWPAVVA